MATRKAAPCTIALAALIAPAPLLAGESIWRDIEAGMTVEQVRALYPVSQEEGRKVEHHDKNTELHGFMSIGKCKPRVEVLHPNGLVTGVLIWMLPQGVLKPMCTKEARAAVLAKFGAPDTQDNRPPQIGEPYKSDIETLTWSTQAMVVIWRHRSPYDAWSIEYVATAPDDAAEL